MGELKETVGRERKPNLFPIVAVAVGSLVIAAMGGILGFLLRDGSAPDKHAAARALYGEGSLEGRQWAESTMVRLAEGDMAVVLEQLKRLRPRRGKEAAEELRKLIGYLEGQRERLAYVDALENGYPIGSGGIESANKFLCHARMKRSGAWWVEESGNEMLRVRCAMYNGTYDRVFAHYVASRSPATPTPPENGTNG